MIGGASGSFQSPGCGGPGPAREPADHSGALTDNLPFDGPGAAVIDVIAGARGRFYGQAMVPGHVYPFGRLRF